MAVVKFPDTLLSLDCWGKFGKPNFYGGAIYGMAEYGDVIEYSGIYQHRHNKGRKIVARLRHYWPTNSQMTTQQTWRQVFADGMAEWMAMSDGDKAPYNIAGVLLRLPGYAVYLKEYLPKHRL